jgi:hypothetical protein
MRGTYPAPTFDTLFESLFETQSKPQSASQSASRIRRIESPPNKRFESRSAAKSN